MKLRIIINALERFAPMAWQEEYDNSGLQVGLFDEVGMPLGPEAEIKGVLVCLDITEAVIDEAAARGCNLVVSHHPLIFRPLKNVSGTTYQQRCVAKALRLGIALYAAHTNLDNAPGGVSWEMATRLGLREVRVLVPSSGCACFSDACAAGSARGCSVDSACSVEGVSPAGMAYPAECAIPAESVSGSGVIGVLPEAVPAEDLVRTLAAVFNAPHLRYCLPSASSSTSFPSVSSVGTALSSDRPTASSDLTTIGSVSLGNVESLIRTVALCGGSGGEFIPDAIAAGADCYVTGEIRYHDYFEAEGRMLVALGHYESEQYTIDLLARYLEGIVLASVPILKTTLNTNPLRSL